MKIWNIKARFSNIRWLWPFCLIIEKENANLLDLLTKLNLSKKVVIDIGCGTGNVLQLFSEKLHFVGLDISWEMLTRIHLNKKVDLVQGDANHLPIKGACVELVLSVGLLEYLPNRIHLVKELTTLLKDNGHLLITSSPPGIFTWLRQLHGIKLKGVVPSEVIDVAQKLGLILVKQKHSLMQDQYLFQRKRVTKIQSG